MNLIELLIAFVATYSFSILFNAPKKDLIYCGFNGLICWFFYQLIMSKMGPENNVLACFVAALAVTVLSRHFSYLRKAPITIYLLGGIIPIVPGAGIYYTMYHMIQNDNLSAFTKGVETLKISGVIAIGIIFVLSLPSKFFKIKIFSK